MRSIAFTITAILMVAGSAFALADSVSITIGGNLIKLQESTIVVDGEVYVPLEILTHIQSPHKKTIASDKSIFITLSNGTAYDVPLKNIAEKKYFPLLASAEKLGYYAYWNRDARRVDIRSRIIDIEYLDGKLTVYLGYPCNFNAKEFSNPRRLVIDIPGAQLVGPSETRDIGAPELSMVKIGQYESNIARVVLHLGEKTIWRLASRGASAAVEIHLKDEIPPPQIAVTPNTKAQAKTAIVKAINLITDEPDRVELRILADTALTPKSFFLSNPYRVCLDLVNAKVESDLSIPEIKSSIVTVSRLGEINSKQSSVRLSFEVSRIPAYSVIRHSPNELSLLLRIPDGAGGSLKDKHIVIDPGHGGYQPGARFGDILEKEINLAVAKKLANHLRMIGAKVSLTREDDRYLSLGDRPKLAEDLGADLFISIHCNSNGKPDSISGTETYYHKDDPSSRALAQCVQSAVVKALGLPDLNAKSDTKISSIGLKVLRCATVPAVLVELGFLNHSHDRKKLMDDRFRQAAAEGIADGLRLYVEGHIPAKEDLVESKSPKS